MDVFGHVALSLLVGRALPPRPDLRRATTTGALVGGLLPDVDVVAYVWGADTFLQVHQLYTHNVIALIVLPVLAGLALGALLGRDRGWVMAAVWVGMVFHLIGDVIGLWPVPMLYPFSDARLAFYLLEQDFSLALDVVLVLGAVMTFWDPIAASVNRTRLVFVAALLLGAVAIIFS